ncbi:hypothetical protein D3C81_1930970 [compost metagenome]
MIGRIIMIDKSSMKALKIIFAARLFLFSCYSSFEPNNPQLSLFAKYMAIRRNTDTAAA